MAARRFTVQSKKESTFERDQLQIPGGVSQSSELEQGLAGTGDVPQGQAPESEAYSAEEQALVEERLKNLGYL